MNFSTASSSVKKKWSVLRTAPIFVKLIVLAMVGVGAFFFWQKFASTTAATPTYLSNVAEKGTLVTSLSASGTITTGNNSDITTRAYGRVKNVFVANGDSVVKGQKIAEIELDPSAVEARASAWVAYLDAQEAVKTAQKAKQAADIQMWKDRQAIQDAQDNIELKNTTSINPDTDKEFTIAEKTIIDKTLPLAYSAFDASELIYKNADSEIQKARTKVSAAWQEYQELSATVVAPSAGTVSNLALSPGVLLENTNDDTTDGSSEGTTLSSQKIGKVENKAGQFQASVNFTEMDIVKIQAQQKVSLLADAQPDLSFTGKVLAIDTTGKVSSGVTNYPVSILLDHTDATLYPNMAVTAQVILSITPDVLLVPASAVKTSDGVSTVEVLENDQPVVRSVEIGKTNGEQTEVLSGIEVGTTVITATIQPQSTSSSTSASSPFSSSSVRGFGAIGGTGAVRMAAPSSGGR